MSEYIYAVIPYKSGIEIKSDYIPCVWNPQIPKLDNIDSEFVDPNVLQLFEDFLVINTCYKKWVFTNCKNGYSRIRAELYKIAQALNANDIWYVDDYGIEKMEIPDFSFDEWIKDLKQNKGEYTADLTREILKGDTQYSYYHDDFSDILLESPK